MRLKTAPPNWVQQPDAAICNRGFLINAVKNRSTHKQKTMNTILDTINLWSTAQTLKTSNRGLSASNQNLLGIKKLRELILELAVRGKLVSQDLNDEPASELLKQIAKEKARLIKEGKIKKQEVLSEVGEDEKPFELPEKWEWRRLGNLGYTQTGGTPSKNDQSLFGNEIPFIKPGDIYPNHVDYSNEGLSIKGAESLGRLATGGSILMVCIGTIGKSNSINRTCAFNQQINSISPYVMNSDYLLLALNSKYFQDKAWEKSSSTTIAILNKGKWENICLPISPLAEQYRIVAKVDELMALCDQLEQQQTNSNAAHQTLVETLLATLTNAESPAAFDEAWQRIATHFDILFTTEHSIDQLKQTILQLAVMGKLTQQNPSDEPASKLLKKIAKEKAQLVKEGKIKKQAPLPEIKEDEKPFELPVGWEFVRWDTIALKIGDIDHMMPEEKSKGYPYVSPRDFLPNNRIDLIGAKKISEEDFKRLSAKIQPQRGDIIYPRYGTIGENRLVETDENFLASYSCCVIKTMHNFINPRFQFIFSISLLTKAQAKKAENKTTQANVGIKSIQNYIVPLPPLAEQHRIVSKVDELFALCDDLKERLRTAQTLQNHLAETVVEQAIN